MNLLEDIILDVFESAPVEVRSLDEGFFPLSPALAFLTLKRNTLKKLKKASINTESSIKSNARDFKSKALIAKEKIRAGAGITSGKGSGATVYKLTPDQLEFLSQIQEKYGSVIIDDVMKFRQNVLAPYQLIKRIVRSNKSITSKEKLGMSHAQFKSSVESGRKKISKRGDVYDNKSEEVQRKITDLGKSIDNLKILLDDFKSKGIVKEHIVNRILKQYHLDHSEFENITLDDLKKTFSELEKNDKYIQSFLDLDGSDEDKELEMALKSQDLVSRSLELRKGVKSKERKRAQAKKDQLRISDLDENVTPQSHEFLFKGGKFNIALGKYMLRKEIISKIRDKNDKESNNLYIGIVNELIDSAIERKSKLSKIKAGLRTAIEFNDIERKIYKIRKSSTKEYSNDLDDYIQIIKDEDFGNTEYIKRNPKLVSAEKKVEAEIKRFERSLKKQIDTKDFNKLKEMRLINNLITVKEMENPDKLFKSSEEIKKMKEE